jgi:cysteine-rich repeat protein
MHTRSKLSLGLLCAALTGCPDNPAVTTDPDTESSSGTDTTAGDDTTEPTATVPTGSDPSSSTTVDPPTSTTVDPPTTDPSTSTTDPTGVSSSTGGTASRCRRSTGTSTTGDTSTGTTDAPGVCGDGVVDGGEQCDDGPDNGDMNACTSLCQAAACGDGLVGPGEQCDDGPDNGDMNACTSLCLAAACGDSLVGPGEECDNGPDNGDMNACTSLCLAAFCGDGLVGPGEGCDDGNQDDADECTNACALPTCGDGIASMSEACDDGNADDTDLCTSACTTAACGDTFIQPLNGEACDDGPDNSDNGDCTGSCNLAACGDNLIHDQGSGNEQCDNGNANGPGALCNALCELNVCGDGDQSPAEACDDGGLVNGDGCNDQCQTEACDDGMDGDQDDGCTDFCTLPACGDGFEQPSTGEQCDLGNANSDTGACTAACKDAVCGDALVQAGVEQCDNGNANANDKACKADCTDNTCGDGFVEAGVEECDDANAVDNDGCSNVCKAATCNDGVKNGAETDVDCGGSLCNICPSLVLLAGGNGSDNGVFVASFTAAGGWVSQTLAGRTVDDVSIAMMSDNTAVGLHRFTQIGNPIDNRLQYTTWNKGVWTPLASIDPTVTTQSWPAAAAAGTQTQAVFRGFDNKHYFAAYNGGVWSPIAQDTGAGGTVAPDIAALGANAVMLFNDGANANKVTARDRIGGVWGNSVLLSGNEVVTSGVPLDILALNGNKELLALWYGTSITQLRYSFRSNGVWSAPLTVPNAAPGGRIQSAALPAGSAAIAFRANSNQKFRSTVYNGLTQAWLGAVKLLPPANDPVITGPPAIAPGIGSSLAEAVFVSGGKIFHTRFNGNIFDIANASWSAPVEIGGNGQVSVALVHSN